jgi:hypothetical protein
MRTGLLTSQKKVTNRKLAILYTDIWIPEYAKQIKVYIFKINSSG